MTTTSADSQVGSLLRELREMRRMSVRTLAAKAGFSASFISQVEHGLASPSIASLEKLAAALGVTLAEFFQTGEWRGPAVVRAEQRARIESAWPGAEIESLGVDRNRKLEPVLITLRAGGASGKHPHGVPREQFAFVVSGEVTLVLDGAELLLRQGDAVTILASRPFRWVNSWGKDVQLLIVSSRTP